jgi:glutamate-1-semialdehyde 2,1-aminomutase
MSAGIATLTALQQPDVWPALEAAAARLSTGIIEAAREKGVSVRATRVGTMFTTFFTEQEPLDWPSVKTCDTARYGRFFRAMLEHGVYLAPSQFEAGFISTAHTPEIISATIEAARQSF